MKPKDSKPDIIYRIINRESGTVENAYSRAYCDEYDFASPDEARMARVDDTFRDRRKYKVAKYRVTYTLLDDDVECDVPDITPVPPRHDGEGMFDYLWRLWRIADNE